MSQWLSVFLSEVEEKLLSDKADELLTCSVTKTVVFILNKNAKWLSVVIDYQLMLISLKMHLEHSSF